MAAIPMSRGGRSAVQWRTACLLAVVGLALLLAPRFIYVTFLMQLMCFALVACAFNLVGGFAGTLNCLPICCLSLKTSPR